MRHRSAYALATLVTLALTALASAGATDTTLARDLLRLVNQHRAERRLPALVPDSRIGREAQRHSAAMASGAAPFGHDGFVDRITALRRVMSCRTAAENVAAELGYDDPAEEIVRGWLASTGHRKNIEGGYDTTGIGIARSPAGKVYVTQIFVAR